MTDSGGAGRKSDRRLGVLLAGMVALLPLVAFAGFAVTAALDAYRAAGEVRLRDTARALAAAVDAQLGSHLVSLETLAASRLLAEPADVAAFEEQTRTLADRLGVWIALIDLPPGHRLLSHSGRTPGAPLPSALPAEAQAVLAAPLAAVFAEGRPAISDLFPDPLTGRPVVAATLRVERPGQPMLALAQGFEPASLGTALARQDLPAGTFAAIADGGLRILAHSFDPEGRRVGAPAPAWVGAAVEGKQRTLVVGPGWSGQQNVYAVERLSRAPGWTVTVAEPLALQRASGWEALLWLLAGASALGLGIVLVIWASRREAVRTARREAEALRAGRRGVERLHGALPAVIFLSRVVVEGGVVRVERLYRGGDTALVLGWPPEALAALDNLEPIADYGNVPMARHFRAAVELGEHQWEWRVRRQDGSWSWIRTRARRLGRAPDGSAEVVGYNLNIDREREAEARALAVARLASLGEMAAGLAHEIKQPLQSISLAAELAQLAGRAGNAAELDRRLERIVEQTQRTAELIERLRRFARGAEDAAVSDAVPLDAAVKGALDLARSALRDASVGVEVALGEPVPVVRGHAVLLEQVLSNLLLNARDALQTRPPDAPRRIRITAAPGPAGTVRLTIADTGGGIAPQVMARLFEPFVTTKGPDKGTGLGLSICHGLLKTMGGAIEAHNDAEGAVFALTLQGVPAEEAVAGPDREPA